MCDIQSDNCARQSRLQTWVCKSVQERKHGLTGSLRAEGESETAEQVLIFIAVLAGDNPKTALGHFLWMDLQHTHTKERK